MRTVTQGEIDAIGLSPASKLLANWAGYLSPSQLNPFELNPLRDLIAGQIDFEQLRATCPFKLLVCATQANTGKLRVFRESELTLDMLLASACVLMIHHAVEVDGGLTGMAATRRILRSSHSSTTAIWATCCWCC